MIRIIYGYPSSYGIELAAQGKAILGGCIIEPDSPSHACLDCLEWWRFPSSY